MTELSFLLDLLLHHKLSKETKEKITARLKEVEDKLTERVINVPAFVPTPLAQPSVPQAASTLALMAKHGDVAAPPAQVAQTPQALAAMASRNRAIQESIAGKVNNTEGKPRKF